VVAHDAQAVEPERMTIASAGQGEQQHVAELRAMQVEPPIIAAYGDVVGEAGSEFTCVPRYAGLRVECGLEGGRGARRLPSRRAQQS